MADGTRALSVVPSTSCDDDTSIDEQAAPTIHELLQWLDTYAEDLMLAAIRAEQHIQDHAQVELSAHPPTEQTDYGETD